MHMIIYVYHLMSVILYFRNFTVLRSQIHVSAACTRGSRNRNNIEGFFI